MAKVRIEVFEVDNRGSYALVWTEDGEEGAHVGESGYTEAALEARVATAKNDRNFDDYEFYLVELEMVRNALRLGALRHRSGQLRYQDYHTAMRGRGVALAARQLAKTSFHIDVPMPDWATKALEAGWKAPKGWKP